jgi:hypothetical protein
MNYAIEMASGGLIYTSSFIMISLGIQKLLVGRTDGRTDRQTHTQQDGFINVLLFFSK